eukprot:3133915-Pleurochrysis_carterae.AAC.3
MARRTPYASRNTDSSSSVDLSNYVEETELENLLGTAASKGVTDVVAFANSSLVTSNTIYNHLLDYIKWTSVEIGNTLSDSSSFIASSKSIRAYLQSVISNSGLGSASTRSVTINSITSGSSLLPTSGAVWGYLQPYTEQLNTISQWGPPTPQPTYFYDDSAAFSCVLGANGTYTFTFLNTLPTTVYAATSLERTNSSLVDNCKCHYRVIDSTTISVVTQVSVPPPFYPH